MKIHERIKIPNVKKILNIENNELSDAITQFYDEVAKLMFLPEIDILSDGELNSLANLATFNIVMKKYNAITNQNIFRIYSDTIAGIREKRLLSSSTCMYIRYFYHVRSAKKKDTLPEAKEKLHQRYVASARIQLVPFD